MRQTFTVALCHSLSSPPLELDDRLLVDSLTGNASVYRRRGEANDVTPSTRPQLRPKRIKFVLVAPMLLRLPLTTTTYYYHGLLLPVLLVPLALQINTYYYYCYYNCYSYDCFLLLQPREPPTPYHYKYEHEDYCLRPTQDLSGSMYTFNRLDRRLQRVQEAVVLLLVLSLSLFIYLSLPTATNATTDSHYSISVVVAIVWSWR